MLPLHLLVKVRYLLFFTRNIFLLFLKPLGAKPASAGQGGCLLTCLYTVNLLLTVALALFARYFYLIGQRLSGSGGGSV